MKTHLHLNASPIIIAAIVTFFVGNHSTMHAESLPVEPAANSTLLAEKKAETITSAKKDPSSSQLQDLAAKDPKAAYDLALRYFRGDGVPQNSYLAIQTMRDSGDKGFLEAQKALGQLYFSGLEEMGSDLNEAHKWLSMAAGRGDKEATELLKKVTTARGNEKEWPAYRRHLRPYTYRYWYHDSLYRLYWRHGRWRYY